MHRDREYYIILYFKMEVRKGEGKKIKNLKRFSLNFL